MLSPLRGIALLARLSADGLIRKKGRSSLTALGVIVGVFALTLIISLGEGMANILGSTVSGESNMRQIGISGGMGEELGRDIAAIKIEGEMDDRRRERLRRAAIARTRGGPRIGRRTQALSPGFLRSLTEIEHVETVEPLVLDRYRVEMEEHSSPGSLTLGIDAEQKRMSERVIAGNYFSDPEASEVLIHEYLAYRWGFVTDEQLSQLVGRELELHYLGSDEGGGFGGFGSFAQQALEDADFSLLTEEERMALPGIILKLPQMLGNRAEEQEISRSYRIAGVIRDREASDPFSVIEDGNTFQVDLFLPQYAANQLFLLSPVNREIGYPRALVTVDSSANAAEVEQKLRDKGLTAFSVAGVVSTVEGVLAAVTVIVAFLTGIALLVAALGILNTMVTSVLERTREIGLWKAVGATDAQVRIVFTIEAAIIGLLGGLVGLGLAVLLSIPGEAIAQGFIRDNSSFPISGQVFQLPLWLAFTGPGIALVVAVLAALYPAWRASAIDPVRALRHE